jgi:hypothetical protein
MCAKDKPMFRTRTMTYLCIIRSTYGINHVLCILKIPYGKIEDNKNLLNRRKIRLIEGNAKCRYLKKFTCKGTWRKVFICLRPRIPSPPPLYTVYVYTVYLFTQGRWEGEVEPERRLKGQQFTKLGRKYQYVYKL